MIALLDEISKEFKNLKEEDFIEPPLPFAPQKHILIAEMSETLKRLFTLWFRARYATRDLKEKLQKSTTKTSGAKIANEANKAVEKERALEGIFWYTVSAEHDDLNKPNIAVTKGFQVVHDR